MEYSEIGVRGIIYINLNKISLVVSVYNTLNETKL